MRCSAAVVELGVFRRFYTRPVKRRSFATILLLSAVTLGGGLTWRVRCSSPRWQIRRTFPGAEPYFDPLNSPDPTVSQFIRLAVPTYLAADEPIGLSLTDCPDSLDLQQRFFRLSHLRIRNVHFTRCRITNLCPTSERGFPSFILFDDCDFSKLPADQRAQLRLYDPTNPAASTQLCIGDV
jgi:hypothetical protein